MMSCWPFLSVSLRFMAQPAQNLNYKLESQKNLNLKHSI